MAFKNILERMFAIDVRATEKVQKLSKNSLLQARSGPENRGRTDPNLRTQNVLQSEVPEKQNAKTLAAAQTRAAGARMDHCNR